MRWICCHPLWSHSVQLHHFCNHITFQQIRQIWKISLKRIKGAQGGVGQYGDNFASAAINYCSGEVRWGEGGVLPQLSCRAAGLSVMYVFNVNSHFGNPIISSFSALITWHMVRPAVVMVIWRFMKAAMKVPITLLTRGGDTLQQLFTRTNTTPAPAPSTPQQQQQQTAVIRKQQYEHGVQTLPRETH